jgi:ABC-type glycerol-3-phosphate transport system substrate-binding protein
MSQPSNWFASTAGLLSRRDFIAGSAGLAAGGFMAGAGSAFGQAAKTGTVRVWGEPGPYGGVAVAGMNEWAAKNAPGLKFEIETIPWDGVYVKLMTDLAARRPPNLISVESPIAYQLMAEGLLEPVDALVDRVGRDRRDRRGRRPAHRPAQMGVLGRLERPAIRAACS